MAHSNLGYKEATGTETVSITGAAAGNLSIYATGADATFILDPNRNDDGSTFTIPDGFTVTLNGISIKGFTVTPGAGTCHCYWW